MSRSVPFAGLRVLFCLQLLAACVSSSGVTGFDDLLSREYSQMTTAELVRYEQELSDELARTSGSSSRDISVGLDFGSWGGSSGFGLHSTQKVGNGGAYERAVDLRNRRDQVREEMRRRGEL